jgi:hypothetical protein
MAAAPRLAGDRGFRMHARSKHLGGEGRDSLRAVQAEPERASVGCEGDLEGQEGVTVAPGGDECLAWKRGLL